MCTPRLCCEGRTGSPGREGDGGSIFWKTREIGFPSYSKIGTLWIQTMKQAERKRTLDGQRIMFSVKISAPRNDLSLNRAMLKEMCLLDCSPKKRI
jgi:hypothetical protein